MKADLARLRRAIAAPPRDVRLFLLHGPDAPGAAAAGAQLVAAFGADAERIDLDGTALRRMPGLLTEEAASLSLFGAARVIRVHAMGEESLEAVSLLLAAERPDGHPVIALAPGLRATSKVVKLVLAAPDAMAVAFYEPTLEELERHAAALARDEGLLAEPGVARRLVDAVAGDRLILMREVEKLALYLDASPDRPRPLDHAAVDAVGAGVADTALDTITTAVVDGDPALLGDTLNRLGDGGAAISWLRAVERRLVALGAMRVDLDAGDGAGEVMKRHRVFFRAEAATAAALRRWTPTMISRALARLQSAERAIMAAGNAGSVVADAAALELARGVAARR